LPPINRIIFTDASYLGWGIHSNGVSNGGRWNEGEKEYHINILELLANQKRYKDSHIKVMSDNTKAISYIKNMGGTKSTLQQGCQRYMVMV